MSSVHWIPLESNPDVLNKYAHNLGLSKEWNFMDVFSLNSEILAMLPSPAAALLFIYPITEQSERAPIGELLQHSDGGVYFMKQTVSNACGTVALLHAIANKRDQLSLEKGSTLEKFFAQSQDCSPAERAKLMESDEVQSRLKFLAKVIWSNSGRRRDPAGVSGLNTAHEAAANEGQTSAPERDSRTNLHFIALLHHHGRLLEFDGRREGPVSHGATSEAGFLGDCAAVVQRFMARESGELNFSIVALARGESPF